MIRKLVLAFLLAASLVMAGCHHAKVQNPIANIGSKQPDKVLFDRAMVSMKKARYTEARTLLDMLIQTYPDSEYVARAKLALGDAWYAEGGTAGLQEAEVQYKDFITFFPNMPEAAEAQFKVANIHYKQMEKPDRDFTQAMRAADEYKTMITQFPDSKLVPEAKQRLREVQEILADRQWRIARFYYLRNNFAASQARLTSLVESYPLYSGADEALFMLGNIYEKQADAMRAQKKVSEVVRAKLAAEYDQEAIGSYTRLLTRYPVMDRADDARKRLLALKAPVPKATPEAIAQNQAEEDSRVEPTRFHKLVHNFMKRPDVSMASDVGEPNLEEEKIDSAVKVIQQFSNEVKAASATTGAGPVPGANQPPPSSRNTPTSTSASAPQPASATANSSPAPPAASQDASSSQNDLPVIGSDKATAPSAPAATGNASPPRQVNEIGATTEGSSQDSSQTAQSGQPQNASDQQDSSSKKKKKKGLRKIIPF